MQTVLMTSSGLVNIGDCYVRVQLDDGFVSITGVVSPELLSDL